MNVAGMCVDLNERALSSSDLRPSQRAEVEMDQKLVGANACHTTPSHKAGG